MIAIREACGNDVAAIREIFLATYPTGHTDRRYCDDSALTRLVYSDDVLLLVAEDSDTGQVVGTASVDLEVGAHSDLVGEFCRLAVLPDQRHRGIGRALMSERLRRVADRLQVGIVEARASHPFSIKIAEANHFAVVGFVPERWRVAERENIALLVRHFGNALELRVNHPRIVPEIHALAHVALENCKLPPDAIVDEDSHAYPPGGSYDVQELTTDGYSALLRIERGRVRNREIFGPARLHYGIFKLQARRSRYLIARENGRVAGAVGFSLDPVDKVVQIFELISLHDDVIRFLLANLERSCREDWECLIEVDVSARAPRMQRTLIELGFMPVAYFPAMAFHDVERLDVIRYVRLLAPPTVRVEGLTPDSEAMAELVLRLYRNRTVLPRIARAVHAMPLFAGLNDEQVTRLAGVCGVAAFLPGEPIFREGEAGRHVHVVLHGEVAIDVADSSAPVGTVSAGECLGEMSLLTSAAHSATATARTAVETVALAHQDLAELIRVRPDIGLHIYRNLAIDVGQKLKRVDSARDPQR